jgi:hypothetical protein
MQRAPSYKGFGSGKLRISISCVSRLKRLLIRSKVVENLAVINYDTNNLYLAPYDWRLSYYNLEVRDGYFSRLKTTIEGLKCVALPKFFRSNYESTLFRKRQNKKVVVAAHSMGSTVRHHHLYTYETWYPNLKILVLFRFFWYALDCPTLC